MPNVVAVALKFLTEPQRLPNEKAFSFVACFLQLLAVGYHSFETSKFPVPIQQIHEMKKNLEKVEVSSNQQSVNSLFAAQAGSSWMPTSSDSNSWIRIHLKSGVILRDVSVLVNVRDGVHCPQVMRVRFGSSSSDFTGDETVTCLHNLCSRTDDWRIMQVLEVPAKLAQSRVLQISFPDSAEPRVYGVVVRSLGDGNGSSEVRQPLFKDFALRCLDASLASDEKSAVADAEEHRGKRLRMCIRWLQLFHEDKRFAPREVSTKSCVFESEHPYPHNADVVHKISFPGAERLEITFDERCRTETGCDYLQFFHPVGFSKTMIGQSNTGRNGDSHWPGVNGVPPLIHRGSHLEARFRSDGNVNDWGYLFTVKAFYAEKSSGDSQSFPHIAFLLRSSIESIVFDLCFLKFALALPHSDFIQPNDIKCISRCFSSQACSNRLQAGMLASTALITAAGLQFHADHCPPRDILPTVAALSMASSIYFKAESESSSSAQSATPSPLSPLTPTGSLSLKSHAFMVGDTVRLIESTPQRSATKLIGNPSVSSVAACDSNQPSITGDVASGTGGRAASSVRKTKGTGTIIQVKNARCVVKGLTGGKPYSFKHDQLELVNSPRDIIPSDNSRTISVVDGSNLFLLTELQSSILTQVWRFVSVRQIDGSTFEALCASDRKVLFDVARTFETTSLMYHVAASVGPALLFLRLFTLFSAYFDQSSHELWSDPDSALLMNSLRMSLRGVASLLPRVLIFLPEPVVPRALAALLSFVIRGSANGASSALVSRFQLSASILNIVRDHVSSFWPSVIQILYSKECGRDHNPLSDLSLLCACKEFNEPPSEKYFRLYESDHPYTRGSSKRFDIEFPGMCVNFYMCLYSYIPFVQEPFFLKSALMHAAERMVKMV
jgi:hypothetical protein